MEVLDSSWWLARFRQIGETKFAYDEFFVFDGLVKQSDLNVRIENTALLIVRPVLMAFVTTLLYALCERHYGRYLLNEFIE